MNTTDIWYSAAVLISGFGFIVFFAIASAYSAYITKKHFEEMLAAVSQSQNLHIDMKVRALGGFSRKLLAPGVLYRALCNPRMLADEYLTLEDIKTFPPHLLCLLAREKLLHNIALLLFLCASSLVPLKP